MSNTTLIVFLAIGWAGGVVLGLRVGRANPSRKALQAHDDAVMQAFAAKLSELTARRKQATRTEGGERG
ncbi:hypothetical protein ACIBCH_41825 [Amycolatopsis thailandensis]|uniref:hypothetical protein n=1 Tax=Amycolatopsis thailandensis TaxID=589330 RepID=UPI00379FA642